MKRSIFVTAFLITTCLAFGQKSVDEQYPENELAKKIYVEAVELQKNDGTRANRVSWVSNRTKDNWFISIGGGVGTLWSEDYEYLKFEDKIKPTGTISIGKWASPALGFQISLSGAKLQGIASSDGGTWYTGYNYKDIPGSSKGYTTATTSAEAKKYIVDNFLNKEYNGKDNFKGYTYDVLYGAATFDVLWNLKNTFTAYNPKGFFNPVLYAGVGLAHTFKDNKISGDDDKLTATNNLVGKAGLQLNFRLHDHWNIFLDGQAMVVGETFDRQVGGDKTLDAIVNAMVGFTYSFNFNKFIRSDFNDPMVVDELNRKINELQMENNQLKNRPVPKCPECPETTKVVVKEEKSVSFLPTPVFFSIGSAAINSDPQYFAIERAALYLKENPAFHIQLTGYADKQTGNPTLNKELSKKRVEAVAKILTEKHGIAKSRLIMDYKGDTEQPYKENDRNRIVIFILED